MAKRKKKTIFWVVETKFGNWWYSDIATVAVDRTKWPHPLRSACAGFGATATVRCGG